MKNRDQIMTVKGPIEPSELGITLPHEHLLVDLYKVFQPHREMKLIDRDLASAELQLFKDAGGSTIVELTTLDLSRDPHGLLQISETTGVNIVMASGWYREPFYQEIMWRKTTKDLSKELIHDINEGVDGIRPGIIGEIGTHNDYISPIEERVHRAAARAHLETGLTITTHANASPVGLAQLDLLEEEGVDLSRVVIGHCDTYPYPDYHQAILDRGAWVEFDTIRGNFEFETNRQVNLVVNLVHKGFINRILLSQDMAVDRFYTVYGGKGFTFLITTFRQRLLEAGISEDQIKTLLIENPKHMLLGS
jgi:phosphotriesterase-related protein